MDGKRNLRPASDPIEPERSVLDDDTPERHCCALAWIPGWPFSGAPSPLVLERIVRP